ncbi:dihydrolipoyl dehydrogenase [Sphingobium sp.]|uniref:dihydrolipoyl dehydrogenase n=1 Tax=Sphingobium sp. TaxID=1912891 RepID=UPI002CFB0282|nr:dihydrolipoyl dehydrogenase [Sphingobium sp.]HUD92567.1 dihydrolipoyl dehydrogenase [Sphingobium sp.]
MYDVIIIGGGPGGYNAAIRAGQLGLSVAVIEGAQHLGGTCLNVGCMPAKSLLHASELYEMARTEFASFGIAVEPRLDLARMMAQKTEAVAKLVKGVEFLFRKNKVEWVRGWGRLDGESRVRVTGSTGEISVIEGRNIVLATGSRPSTLPGVCVDHRNIVTSTEALSFTQVPDRLIVIGAGVVGLEMGSIWCRLGSEVTVLEYADTILPGTDREIARTLERSLRKQGLNIRLGVRVASATPSDGAAVVTIEADSGVEAEKLMADKVLVAVGRRAFTDGLGLEVVGIVPDARGAIPHDGHYRTSAPGVWVIGDVTHGAMLAHKAEEEAIECIEIIAGKVSVSDDSDIPVVVYTRPELAAIGASEEELTAAGIDFRVGRFQFMANSRARINHETDGLVKMLVDTASDRILGIHMVGPQVGEMIAEARMALTFAATAEDVARTIHPHPTRSEALRQAAMDSAGWAMQA